MTFIRRLQRKKAARRRWTVALLTLSGIFLICGVALISLSVWYRVTFNITFKELLYTLASPLKGTGRATVSRILLAVLPPTLTALVLYVVFAVLLIRRKKRYTVPRRIVAGASACILLASGILAVFCFRIPAYFKNLGAYTRVYDDYFVDPASVAITAEGSTKNVILIYMESMETTYASVEAGGQQPVDNYMPRLTELAAKEVSFSDREDDLLGGLHTPTGTNWTMASLLASSSGVNFMFPVEGNAMGQQDSFANQLITLGDILEQKGYTNEFICGSDATFGGRRTYLEQHGNYRITDFYAARAEGYIPEDYYVFWGYEDTVLYRIAKERLLALAEEDKPFNLTLLTIDTHHIDGYLCSECGDEYEIGLANVIACADRQVTEFVDWCRGQEFFEDTVIVITGDHPRMDNTLVADVRYFDRTVYNCFINSAVEPADGADRGRTATVLDLFPTTLAAMGFRIDGNRLVLGTNLFSGIRTLPERIGYNYLNNELDKISQYFLDRFFPSDQP